MTKTNRSSFHGMQILEKEEENKKREKGKNEGRRGRGKKRMREGGREEEEEKRKEETKEVETGQDKSVYTTNTDKLQSKALRLAEC